MFKKKSSTTIATSLNGIISTFTSCVKNLENLKNEANAQISANNEEVNRLQTENNSLNDSIVKADNIINNINKIIA